MPDHAEQAIRAAFELWYQKERPDVPARSIFKRVYSGERYISLETEWAYRGYKQSRLNPQADGTASDKYRAELYDEVWEKARSMGYANVTDALVALERKG